MTEHDRIEQLDPARIREMFRTSSVFVGHWAPITIVSYAIDHAVWGRRAFGYHLTNLLLHALCTVLLYVLLCRLLGRDNSARARIPASLAALLFAIHPVQVETVAWIAERKNLLAMALLLGAFLTWLRATRAPFRPWAYVTFLVLVCSSLLAKSQAVILPPLLVLYEWVERRDQRAAVLSLTARMALLVPGFVLASWVAWVAIKVQGSEKLVWVMGDSIGAISTAPVLIFGYIKDLLLPMNRSAILARTVYDTPWHAAALAAWLLLLFWIFGAVSLHRRRPHLAFFSLWFLGALVPVLNLVPFPVLAADRYQYWAAPGLFALAGLGAHAVWVGLRPVLRPLALGSGIAIAGLLIALTVSRVQVWEDSLTLWTDAVAKTPDDWIVLTNLSAALQEAGRFEEAEQYARKAARLAPEFPQARNTLSAALLGLGQTEEAEHEAREALRLHPRDAHARSNLSAVLLALGKAEEAEREAREALRLIPHNVRARNNLSAILLALGKAEEAERESREALRLDPKDVRARGNLAAALLAAGDTQRAEHEAREAVRLDPGDARARSNLAAVLLETGQAEEAEGEAREAVRLDPGDARARSNLVAALLAAGKGEEAERQSREAVQSAPDDAEARSNLGATLSLLGKLEEAEGELRQALSLDPNNVLARSSLSIVLLRFGRTEEAEKEMREVLRLAPHHKQTHVNLSALLYISGRAEEALAQAREALKLDPNNAKIKSNLGSILLTLGRTDEAEREIRDALRIDPTYLTARNNLGAVLLKLGKLEQAENEFREVLRIDPENIDATYNRACVAAQLGDRPGAFRWLDRIFELGYRDAARLREDPYLTSLAADPRFPALLERMEGGSVPGTERGK